MSDNNHKNINKLLNNNGNNADIDNFDSVDINENKTSVPVNSTKPLESVSLNMKNNIQYGSDISNKPSSNFEGSKTMNKFKLKNVQDKSVTGATVNPILENKNDSNSKKSKALQKSYVKYFKEFSRLALKTPDILKNHEDDKDSLVESAVLSSTYLSTPYSSNNTILNILDTSISYSPTEDNMNEDIINLSVRNDHTLNFNNSNPSKPNQNNNYSTSSSYRKQQRHQFGYGFHPYDNSSSSSSRNVRNYPTYELPISIRKLASKGGSLRDENVESYYNRSYPQHQHHHHRQTSNNRTNNTSSSVIPSSSSSFSHHNSQSQINNYNSNFNSNPNMIKSKLSNGTPFCQSPTPTTPSSPTSPTSPASSCPIFDNEIFSQSEEINLSEKSNIDMVNTGSNRHSLNISKSLNNINNFSDGENGTTGSYIDFSNNANFIPNIQNNTDTNVLSNSPSSSELFSQEGLDNEVKAEETMDNYALLNRSSFDDNETDNTDDKKKFKKNSTLKSYISRRSLKSKGKLYNHLDEDGGDSREEVEESEIIENQEIENGDNMVEEEIQIQLSNNETMYTDKNKGKTPVNNAMIESTTPNSMNKPQNMVMNSIITYTSPVTDKRNIVNTPRKDSEESDSKNSINRSLNIINVPPSSNNLALKEKIRNHHRSHRFSNNTSTSNISSNNKINQKHESRNRYDNRQSHRISYDEFENYGDLNVQSLLTKSLYKYIPSMLRRQEKNKKLNENIQNLEGNKTNDIGLYSSNVDSDVYEEDWSLEMVKNGILTNRLISIAIFIISLINIIPYIIFNYKNITIFQWFIISYFYISIINVIFVTLYKWGKIYILSYKHRSIIYIFFMNTSISIVLLDWLYTQKEFYSFSLIFLIFESLTVGISISFMEFMLLVLSNIPFMVAYSIINHYTLNKNILYWSQLLFVICLSGYQLRKNDSNKRKHYLHLKQIQLKTYEIQLRQARADHLLAIVLPKSIALKLRSINHQYELLAERIDSATMLFVDLFNYVEIIKEDLKSLKSTVHFVNKIFEQMDSIINQFHGLEIIKTTTRELIVCGGLSKHPQMSTYEHVVQTILLALEFRKFFEKLNVYDKDDIPINLKIKLRFGIETGSVVTGIIGQKGLLYDIYGDTVNTASRMCHLGKPNDIIITKNVWEICKNDFATEYLGKRFVKGKSEMDVYSIIKKKIKTPQEVKKYKHISINGHMFSNKPYEPIVESVPISLNPEKATRKTKDVLSIISTTMFEALHKNDTVSIKSTLKNLSLILNTNLNKDTQPDIGPTSPYSLTNYDVNTKDISDIVSSSNNHNSFYANPNINNNTNKYTSYSSNNNYRINNDDNNNNNNNSFNSDSSDDNNGDNSSNNNSNGSIDRNANINPNNNNTNSDTNSNSNTNYSINNDSSTNKKHLRQQSGVDYRSRLSQSHTMDYELNLQSKSNIKLIDIPRYISPTSSPKSDIISPIESPLSFALQNSQFRDDKSTPFVNVHSPNQNIPYTIEKLNQKDNGNSEENSVKNPYVPRINTTFNGGTLTMSRKSQPSFTSRNNFSPSDYSIHSLEDEFSNTSSLRSPNEAFYTLNTPSLASISITMPTMASLEERKPIKKIFFNLNLKFKDNNIEDRYTVYNLYKDSKYYIHFSYQNFLFTIIVIIIALILSLYKHTFNWNFALFGITLALQCIICILSYFYHRTIQKNIKSVATVFKKQFYYKPIYLFGKKCSVKTARALICSIALLSNKGTLLILPYTICDYSYCYYFYIIIPTILIYTCTILKKEFSVTYGVLMSLFFSLVYMLEFTFMKMHYEQTTDEIQKSYYKQELLNKYKESVFDSTLPSYADLKEWADARPDMYFNTPTIHILYILTIIIIELISSTIVYYFQERYYRKTFIIQLLYEQKRQQCEKELLKSREMLDNIFPERVAKRLLVDPQSIMYEEFKKVTILHLDLEGFTKLSSTLQPLDVIKILNGLFSGLDTICSEEYGIEKITTVGDAYICCSGLANENNSEGQLSFSDMFFQDLDTYSKYAISICTAAIRMQHYIATELNVQPWLIDIVRRPLKARIGIHTGKISGAIIGSPKFIRYYLVGKASVIAEKVQEACPPGGINISETTRELIRWSQSIKYIPREDNCEVEGYRCYLLDWNK